MNDDHRDAMVCYCRQTGVAFEPSLPPVMAGVDGEGFDLGIGHRVLRFAFDEPVSSGAQVREKLVAIAKGST